MRIETDYRVAVGIPAVMVVGTVATYYLGVVAGLDRDLVLDSATVTVAIGAAAILRGIQSAPYRTWSLELGGLLSVLVAVIALALRSISLASSPGPLFVFAILGSAGLGYVAHRMVRRLARWGHGAADPQSAPPK